MEELKKSVSRTRRTHKEIETLLSAFNKSGLPVNEFCSLHHITRGSFYKWQSRRKVKAAQKTNQAAFARVSVPSSATGALFAEVNGIRFYQPVAASYLKELLS